MTAILKLPRQRLVLKHVSWDFYESVLREIGDERVFVTFDRGRLEIMSPSPEHETYARLVARLVQIVTEELGLPIASRGATTLRRKAVRGGTEPDECFYIRNEPAARGKKRMDFQHDPPPDLVVEIEVTRRLVSRRPIYARLGVPEVWTYNGSVLQILKLSADQYESADRSLSLPALSVDQLNQLLRMAQDSEENAWAAKVRRWIAENLPTP